MAKVKFGEVNITRPHFLLTWRNSHRDPQSIQIAVLSTTERIEDVQLHLLTGDIKHEQAIQEVITEVNYYLFELNNPDPIGYLADYHARNALANVYSNVKFTFVESINTSNIFYFIKIRAKQLRIHDNSFVYNLLESYANIAIDRLFLKALSSKRDGRVEEYNKDFNYLYWLIYTGTPTANCFKIDKTVSIPRFARIIGELSIGDYANILNYFREMGLVTTREARGLLRFYHLNRRYCQDVGQQVENQ